MPEQTYTVSYGPTFWECSILIDKSKETGDAIVKMVEFWEMWGFRLLQNNGDYVKTFLQQLGRKIYHLAARGLEHDDIVAWFNDAEGWSKMDGSAGIKILLMDDFETDYDEFEVVEDPSDEQ